MNKEMIIVRDFEQTLVRDFRDMSELEVFLSERFEEILDKSSDAQDAFNDLNDEVSGLLNKHGFVYYLGTAEWFVTCDKLSDVDSKKLIKEWNNFYTDRKVNTLEELFDSLESVVRDTMCNAGCDAKNALNSVCEEVFENPQFYIDCGDGEPHIEFLRL
ncbi:hypothetical protein ACV3UL_18935 [Clostridium perfringens]